MLLHLRTHFLTPGGGMHIPFSAAKTSLLGSGIGAFGVWKWRLTLR